MTNTRRTRIPIEPSEVSALILRAAIKVADEQGTDSEALLARVGLVSSDLEDVDRYIPRDTEERFWREFVSEVRGPALGLDVAKALDRGDFRELEFLVRSAATLGDGLDRLVTFNQLLHGQSIFELLRAPDVLRLRYLHPHGSDAAHGRAATQFALASIVEMTRDATERAWHPSLVRFRFPAPSDTGPYEAVFKCPLAFDEEQSELVIDAANAEIPMVQADSALHEVLENVVSRQVAEVVEPQGFGERVRRTIEGSLAHGSATLDAVARRFSMSPRTLQAHLLRESTSFQSLLAEARCDQAKLLLARGRTVTTVAYLLGYRDVRAFRRAFRKWTGTSASAYRNQLVNANGAMKASA